MGRDTRSGPVPPTIVLPINTPYDLNGDRKGDLIWRNTTTGSTAIWIMNGIVRASVGFPGGVPLNWQIVGIGDVTGDGKADVIWRPDAFGSVLFLVSSGLAFAPEVRGRRHRHVRDRAWAIGALNMLGSVFFGASAIGAYTVSATGVLLSARWSNLGTFLGAICFLAGARLLLPRGDTGRG